MATNEREHATCWRLSDCFVQDVTKALPSFRDGELLNLYYNAADVFVAPSLAEAFGLVHAEAMAAGTPCVAFDIGASPEVVRHGQTGFVARYKDAADLAACIERILGMSDAEASLMRRASRETAVREYDTPMQAQRYAKLFAEIIAAK